MRAFVLLAIVFTVALVLLGGCAHSLSALDQQQLKCNEACARLAGDEGEIADEAYPLPDHTCSCQMSDESVEVTK